MEYKKEVRIEGKDYVFLLKANKEFVFYTLNYEYDKFAAFDEDRVSFNNLRGNINPFSLFIEIEKYIKYLFSKGVSYFYFSCEKERFEKYNFFLSRLVKNSNYYTTSDKKQNTFYVYK
ncbi:hypothetical protein [Psychromonas ingrahamii]|uniref:hypothetical protein n=1 Tax=Psychromonas ingrahamii TaxID=357794 RepID=UPI0005A1557E|nr:hypothetical protein [Psychromonas ingrahamii]